MLVLSRKKHEDITLRSKHGELIAVVTVADIRGDKVRLGIKAPPDVQVDRREIDELKFHELGDPGA